MERDAGRGASRRRIPVSGSVRGKREPRKGFSENTEGVGEITGFDTEQLSPLVRCGFLHSSSSQAPLPVPAKLEPLVSPTPFVVD